MRNLADNRKEFSVRNQIPPLLDASHPHSASLRATTSFGRNDRISITREFGHLRSRKNVHQGLHSGAKSFSL